MDINLCQLQYEIHARWSAVVAYALLSFLQPCLLDPCLGLKVLEGPFFLAYKSPTSASGCLQPMHSTNYLKHSQSSPFFLKKKERENKRITGLSLWHKATPLSTSIAQTYIQESQMDTCPSILVSRKYSIQIYIEKNNFKYCIKKVLEAIIC